MEQAHLRGNWEMKSSGINDGLDSGGQGGRVWGSTKDDSCVSGMKTACRDQRREVAIGQAW